MRPDVRLADLVPRRADGLPPGQRVVRAFPRFSDKPLRRAPSVGPIELAITRDGAVVAQLTGDDLAHYDQVEQTCDFHCVTTWTYRDARWKGWRVADVMRSIIGDAPPPFAVVGSADGQAAIFMTDDLLQSDVLLATHLDGELLGRRHGAPVRLLCPSQYGYKSVKHVTSIDFGHEEPASTLGPKEHLRARVAVEERHASLPNWALRWPYRLTIIPTALAAERGLRNPPA